MMSIQAYTDGSCSPNPGPGGWAWIWFSSEDPRVVFTGSGSSQKTTNNRMELSALIHLLRDLRDLDLDIDIHIDSQYTIGTLISRKSGGTLDFSSTGKPLYTGTIARITPTRANRDLLLSLDQEIRRWGSKKGKINLFWVEGHSGDPGNDLVDQLAKEATPKI